MTRRPTSFRNIAVALTAATAIGTSSLLSFPAAAQQMTAATKFEGSPACASITDPTAGSKCEIRESERRTGEANKRSKVLDQEIACINMIVGDIAKNGEKTASLTAMPPKGQACKTARELKLLTSG